MAYTKDECRNNMNGFYTAAQRHILNRDYGWAEVCQRMFRTWHSRYLSAIAPPLVMRNEHECCPLCGQHKILHTYISGSTTEPGEWNCDFMDDERDLWDTEHPNWKQQWNELYEQLGWNRDIPY